ncbi:MULTISPECIES: ribosome small subunit-dependent GTPase A [Bacillales]|uniref:ribosome small subunit-dependent GTPase A n=1 Tax=Bacillales TaxID=1385 RepID=UPI000BF4ACCC|nr:MULTISPECIES: ribosome small subunit-dependent GTPase A [Bacillaceae]MCA0990181.1 ribosome small subunit-dependent GTPase A [Pseudalkalibacillus hwajinpoensis]PFG12925.1 ribosome biogenesis GTPase [Bacillus sp. es.036]
MADGRIIKALSGFYYVQDEVNKEIYQCRGRGNFRKRKITPLVGDFVVYEAENKTDGYVLEIKERENELVRPPIANVDQAFLVFSATQPTFNTQLLDKFLVHIEASDIRPIICISKIDLVSNAEENEIMAYADDYREVGYDVVVSSAQSLSGVAEIEPYFQEKVTVFAGQSGVGKSSLLNAINPDLELDTSDISTHLGRGKHTTRHVELIPFGSGLVADTPGFSSLDFRGIEADDLWLYFPEIQEKSSECKFRACTHQSEPGCAVKVAVEKEEIKAYRYDHYSSFFQEIKDQKRRY